MLPATWGLALSFLHSGIHGVHAIGRMDLPPVLCWTAHAQQQPSRAASPRPLAEWTCNLVKLVGLANGSS